MSADLLGELMVESQRPGAEERRSAALAVQRDFRALIELLSQGDCETSNLPEVDCVRASVERGLSLANQLVDRIDGEATD